MLTALVVLLAPSQFNPLPNCTLRRPAQFFEELSALPPVIRSDFESRIGQIYPRSEKNVTFSDAPAPGEKMGKILLYVAHAPNQWLISYAYGGIAFRTVTVSYILNEGHASYTPYLQGAIGGDVCGVANLFLQGATVEPGWERKR